MVGSLHSLCSLNVAVLSAPAAAFVGELATRTMEARRRHKVFSGQPLNVGFNHFHQANLLGLVHGTELRDDKLWRLGFDQMVQFSSSLRFAGALTVQNRVAGKLNFVQTYGIVWGGGLARGLEVNNPPTGTNQIHHPD